MLRLKNLKGLDFAGVPDVGTAAEIDEGAASIGRCPVRLNLLLDDAALEGIVGEEIEELLLRQDATLERLLFLENGFYYVFDGFEVVTRNLSVPVFRGWRNGVRRKEEMMEEETKEPKKEEEEE